MKSLAGTCRWLAVGLAALAAAGCNPARPEHALTRRQLIDAHNANASAIPRLWARAKIALTLTDDGGRTFSWGSTSRLAGANGLLLYACSPQPLGPHDFVLIGRAAGATELFRLGNSASEGVYYLWYHFGDHGRALWGRDALAGATGAAMPIDPMQILAVLNITPLPADFAALPAAVLTLSDSSPWSYVLTVIDRQPLTGEIVCRREIRCAWDDRKEALPYRVDLFDGAGQRVMTAELRDYRPIRAADSPGAAPRMPTDITIVWPQKGSRIHLVLSEMTTAATWDRREALFEAHRPGGFTSDQIIQVDKELNAQGAAK
ncbi:MAG: hypothetical protein MUP47_10690 [Phycisphaerae bacterium]|nr:hypothetical protein [Phycisphaerae bacterium]